MTLAQQIANLAQRIATELNGKAATQHTHPASDLTATGERSSATFLRGDNTWATPPGSTPWWKGDSALPASTDLTTLQPGAYAVWAGSTATSLGLPTSTTGILEAFPFGNTAIQVWRPVTTTMSVWTRSKLTGGWTPWQRIDGAA